VIADHDLRHLEVAFDEDENSRKASVLGGDYISYVGGGCPKDETSKDDVETPFADHAPLRMQRSPWLLHYGNTFMESTRGLIRILKIS
jgi:hypothetical protein